LHTAEVVKRLFLAGTIVNAVAIIVGTGIGLFLPIIPDRMRTTIMQGVALAVILIGLGMALQDQADILLIIISLVIGGLLGEWWDIEGLLLRIGQKIEQRAQRVGNGQVAEAFVTASLIFCVGSMAVVGAIQSGLSGQNKTLYAKSLLDFFTSIVFSTTLGIGIAFAAVPVFLYEGAIALVSHFAGTALNSPPIIACMSATGGLLIVAIGVNLLDLKKISVGNLLPAMIVAAVVKWLAVFVQTLHSFSL
jgi:uncharacterized protein